MGRSQEEGGGEEKEASTSSSCWARETVRGLEFEDWNLLLVNSLPTATRYLHEPSHPGISLASFPVPVVVQPLFTSSSFLLVILTPFYPPGDVPIL